MAQTGRQTDKSTWWSCTAWNDEILLLEDASKYPPDVVKVYGGREICPDTGREHFQGCIQLRKQQRLTWFKAWLPTAHFEPARQKDALKKYAMKTDTASGEKLERTNVIKYYTADEICILVGSKVEESDILETPDPKIWFKRSINKLLRENHKLAAQLMNPSLRNFWCDTANVWIDKAKDISDESLSQGEP